MSDETKAQDKGLQQFDELKAKILERLSEQRTADSVDTHFGRGGYDRRLYRQALAELVKERSVELLLDEAGVPALRKVTNIPQDESFGVPANVVPIEYSSPDVVARNTVWNTLLLKQRVMSDILEKERQIDEERERIKPDVDKLEFRWKELKKERAELKSELNALDSSVRDTVIKWEDEQRNKAKAKDPEGFAVTERFFGAKQQVIRA